MSEVWPGLPGPSPETWTLGGHPVLCPPPALRSPLHSVFPQAPAATPPRGLLLLGGLAWLCGRAVPRPPGHSGAAGAMACMPDQGPVRGSCRESVSACICVWGCV